MFNKNFTIVFLLVFLLYFSNVSGQEIRDDIIYTSLNKQVILYFPESISACEYSEKSARNRFNKRVENTMVSIIAKTKNPEPAILKVSEGKRNHRFILVYKEELSSDERDHDWEDLKVLKNYVSALEIKKSAQKNVVHATSAISQSPNTTDPTTEPAAVVASPIAASSRSANGNKPAETADNYNELLGKAYTFFEKKDYVEARRLFEKAHSLQPDELLARNKISEIDGLITGTARKTSDVEEIPEKELEFKEKIKVADKAFSEQNFEEAKGLYSLALSLKPNDSYSKGQIAKTQKKLDEYQVANAVRQKEQRYQNNINEAKKALADKNYELANASFSQALDAKPNDRVAKDEIEKIVKIKNELARQENIDKTNKAKEVAYNEAIVVATDAFNNGNYTAAKLNYKNALSIKPTPAIENQLKLIETLNVGLANKVVSDPNKSEIDQKKTQNYKKQIENADKAFAMKKYAEARVGYKQALNYKDEQYPKDKIFLIEQIESLAAEEMEEKEKRAEAVAKGKAAMADNDFEKAKVFFEEAATFKSEDADVSEQLLYVYKKLEDIAMENRIEEEYVSILDNASLSITSQDYKKAKDYYKQARSLKPQETYPTKMIAYLDGVLSEINERQKREETAKQRRQILTIKENAVKAISEKRWADALKGFEDILSLNPFAPDREFATTKIPAIRAEIRKTDSLNALKAVVPVAVAPEKRRSRHEKKREEIWAANEVRKEQERLATIDEQVRNQSARKANTTVTSGSAVREIVKEITTKSPQADPLPYSPDELTSKYPQVNFDATPDGQTYDSTDRKNKARNFEISNRIIAEKGNLNVYDSIGHVKAICQSITFNGSNAYIKLIIQNTSSSDFLTGALQLRLIRKNGSSTNLHQRFVSNFPIVMPKKEFAIVYVHDASVNIDPADTLVLEVNDRAKKTQLKINIPGNIYNLQKTVKL